MTCIILEYKKKKKNKKLIIEKKKKKEKGSPPWKLIWQRKEKKVADKNALGRKHMQPIWREKVKKVLGQKKLNIRATLAQEIDIS